LCTSNTKTKGKWTEGQTTQWPKKRDRRTSNTMTKKKDKIKRSVIINEYEEVGLKMSNIQSFYKALKMDKLKLIPNNLNFPEKFHDKCLSGRSSS
jgi:hypothetical protein